MKRILVFASIALGVCAGGCAAQKPVPEAVQDEYFQCRGTIMDRVETNLTNAGYRYGWGEENKELVTEWAGITVRRPTDEAPTRLSLRLKVNATNEGVRFEVIEKSESTSDQGRPWTTITESQTKDTATRAVLNKLRKDVCGGDDFFKG